MEAMEDLPEEEREWFVRHLPYGYKNSENITGAALQQAGLVIPEPLEEFGAWQIHISLCNEE